jgi:large conductance mechanosensitive channel
MSMLKEFKAFAVKGNVVDLAVAVIIGAAFGKIVESLVSDVIMPIVGKIFGGLDFSNYYLPLNNQGMQLPLAEAKKAGAVLAYGNFLKILINFIILTFIIFLMVHFINKARTLTQRKEAQAPLIETPPSEDVLLLREIRDALKQPSAFR